MEERFNNVQISSSEYRFDSGCIAKESMQWSLTTIKALQRGFSESPAETKKVTDKVRPIRHYASDRKRSEAIVGYKPIVNKVNNIVSIPFLIVIFFFFF